MTEELTTKDQIDFAYIYGTIFSLTTTIEFLTAIQGLMAERRANYAQNKAREAEYACQKVHDMLLREITKLMTPEEKELSSKAIDNHKETIYDFFMLTADHQRRIKTLIAKLKKEEDEK